MCIYIYIYIYIYVYVIHVYIYIYIYIYSRGRLLRWGGPRGALRDNFCEKWENGESNPIRLISELG